MTPSSLLARSSSPFINEIDILAALRRRKSVAIALFMTTVVCIFALSTQHIRKTRVVQEIILRKPDGRVTFDDINRFRIEFMRNPFILQHVLNLIPDQKLAINQLQKKLDIKAQTAAMGLENSSDLIEQYRMAFYVTTEDASQARTILAAWVKVCLERVDEINQNRLNSIEKMKQESDSKTNDLITIRNIYASYYSKCSETTKLPEWCSQDIYSLKSPLFIPLALKMESVDFIYCRMQIDRLEKDISDLQIRISNESSEMIDIKTDQDIKTVLRKRDTLLQTFFLAPLIGLIIACLGVAIFEFVFSPRPLLS